MAKAPKKSAPKAKTEEAKKAAKDLAAKKRIIRSNENVEKDQKFLLEKIGPVEKEAAMLFYGAAADPKLRHPFSHYQRDIDTLANGLKRQLTRAEIEHLCGHDFQPVSCVMTGKKFQPVCSTKPTREMIDAIIKAGSVIDAPDWVRERYQQQGSYVYLRVGANASKPFALKGPLYYRTKEGKYKAASRRFSMRRNCEMMLYLAKEKRKSAKADGANVSKAFSYFFGSYEACIAFKEKDVAEYTEYRRRLTEGYQANRAEIDAEFQTGTQSMSKLMESFGINVLV